MIVLSRHQHARRPPAGGRCRPAPARPPPAAARPRCSRRPSQVLDHLPIGRPAQRDDRRHVARVVVDQHDVGRLDAPRPCRRRSRCRRRPGRAPGASFTPSPTMATARAAALQLLDLLALCSGQHLGEELVDAQLRATQRATASRVAGQHRDPHAHAPAAPATASRLSGPDHVGQGEGRQHPPVHDQVDDRLARSPQRARLRRQAGGSASCRLLQQARAADLERRARRRSPGRRARERLEVARPAGIVEAALLGRLRTIARAIVCSLSPLDRRRERQRLVLRRARRRVATPTTPCSPRVSVPVLSKMTTSMRRGRFSSASRSRTRMPLRRRERRGDGDHQRDRQAQRVRAGDHQHRHDPLERVASKPARQRPADQREQRDADRRPASASTPRGRPAPGCATCSSAPR